MEIIKIEQEENLAYTKIHVQHNGIKAYFLLCDMLQVRFNKEINEFQRVFFNHGEVDWMDCFEGNYLETFDKWDFIYNTKRDKELQEIENEYIEQQMGGIKNEQD